MAIVAAASTTCRSAPPPEPARATPGAIPADATIAAVIAPPTVAPEPSIQPECTGAAIDLDAVFRARQCHGRASHVGAPRIALSIATTAVHSGATVVAEVRLENDSDSTLWIDLIEPESAIGANPLSLEILNILGRDVMKPSPPLEEECNQMLGARETGVPVTGTNVRIAIEPRGFAAMHGSVTATGLVRRKGKSCVEPGPLAPGHYQLRAIIEPLPHTRAEIPLEVVR